MAAAVTKPEIRIARPTTGPSVAGVPVGSLFVVNGTRWLDREQWDRLASLPGAFVLYGQRSEPMPAAGTVVLTERETTGRWPEPVYVPVAQVHALADLFHTSFDRLLPAVSADPVYPFRGLDRDGHEYRLRPLQEAAVRRARTLRRSLLPLRVGRGKTAIAIALGNDLLQRGFIDRVVVAAPRRPVTEVWVPLLRQFLGPDLPDDALCVVEGSPKERAVQWATALSPKTRWVLTRYDHWLLPDGQKNLRQLLGPRTFVGIDEVHHLKETLTLRWKAFRDLLDQTQTEYRLFLTGSLLHDTPADAFGPTELLGLRVWSTSFEFESRYFDVSEVGTGHTDWRGVPQTIRTLVGFRSPEAARELGRVLNAVSCLDPNFPVEDDLPPVVERDWVVRATPQEARLYERIVQPVVESAVKGLAKKNADAAPLIASMTIERLFSDDPALLLRSDSPTAATLREGISAELERASPGSKIRALLVYLAQVVTETDTKAFVFSAFTTPLQRVIEVVENPPTTFDWEEQQAAAALRGRMVLYHGGLGDREGGEVLARFHHDPNVRILLSTDAGGESLNLQDVASYVVHLDDPLSLGSVTQRMGRVHRDGQTRTAHVTRFVLDQSERLMGEVGKRVGGDTLRFVDVRIRDLLRWKAAQRAMVWE